MVALDAVQEQTLVAYTLSEHRHKSILTHLVEEQRYRLVNGLEWHSRLRLRDNKNEEILPEDSFPLTVWVIDPSGLQSPLMNMGQQIRYDWSDHQQKNLWTLLDEVKRRYTEEYGQEWKGV